MKCFIDSNILISAGLFPESVPAAALAKAISPPNTAIVSDYSLDETYRAINKKFPHKVNDLELFLYRMLFTAHVVTTPIEANEAEVKIRDINDHPILRAALKADVDVLITGDKDLLESNITNPRIIKPADFINMR